MKDIMVKSNVDNLVEYFEDVIRSFGTSKKRVRFVTLIDTMDKDLGYQVYQRKKPLDVDGDTSFKYLPASGFYEVDLDNKDYKSILEHISYLIISGQCAFVMKQWDVDKIEDLGQYLDANKGMIGAFDLYGPLRPERIYSGAGDAINWDYKKTRIEISGYSTLFRPSYQNWRKLFNYPYVFSVGSRTADLHRYLAPILKNEALRNILGLV
jgi:hypothetical protein